MPRLGCTFRKFLDIIAAHGFVLHRQGATSHRRYRGVHSGKVWFVDVTIHGLNIEIKPKTLASMIRQSGLPKKLFLR